MPTLQKYYCDLLAWEQLPRQKLVSRWTKSLRKLVSLDLRKAIKKASLKGAHCRIKRRSKPQSIGHQVEKFFVLRITQQLEQSKIESCKGQGYPDKALVLREGGGRIAFEIKATSQWNPKDTNRCVLTCSSERLRSSFTMPIRHLLCTVIYDLSLGKAFIRSVRLDFIAPTTSVNVRLEASVNHKILASGPHRAVVL